MRSGRLELVTEVESEVSPKTGWKIRKALVRCDCGVEKEMRLDSIKYGKIKSCGCLHLDNLTTHGMTGTTTHKRWNAMRDRCTPGFKRADRYYDRGIGICEAWDKFETFYADMGECPEGMELDRIDNEKGYSKENCRWTTHQQNMRNRTATGRKGKGSIQNTKYVASRGKWFASCKHEGKLKYLGTFATELEAGEAYNAFAKIHGYPERELYG